MQMKQSALLIRQLTVAGELITTHFRRPLLAGLKKRTRIALSAICLFYKNAL